MVHLRGCLKYKHFNRSSTFYNIDRTLWYISEVALNTNTLIRGSTIYNIDIRTLWYISEVAFNTNTLIRSSTFYKIHIRKKFLSAELLI